MLDVRACGTYEPVFGVVKGDSSVIPAITAFYNAALITRHQGFVCTAVRTTNFRFVRCLFSPWKGIENRTIRISQNPVKRKFFDSKITPNHAFQPCPVNAVIPYFIPYQAIIGDIFGWYGFSSSFPRHCLDDIRRRRRTARYVSVATGGAVADAETVTLFPAKSLADLDRSTMHRSTG